MFVHQWAQHTALVALMEKLLNEPGCDVRRPITSCPQCEIIWTVNRLNDAGLRLLRHSPYLLMRKFPGNASLPGFGKIMFT